MEQGIKIHLRTEHLVSKHFVYWVLASYHHTVQYSKLHDNPATIGTIGAWIIQIFNS